MKEGFHVVDPNLMGELADELTHVASRVAQGAWARIKKAGGSYTALPVAGDRAQPRWVRSIDETVEAAFRDRVIEDRDHPAYRVSAAGRRSPHDFGRNPRT